MNKFETCLLMAILKKKFFNRPTLTVAEELLGCFLCRRIGKKIVRLEITEVEAYDGPEDRASHGVRCRSGEWEARQTPRNTPMFGEGGVWYVYFTYGMHWMLNITTGPVGYPAAILIRGACEGLTSTDGGLTSTTRMTGPARLTKFLNVDKRFNNKKAGIKTGLWIACPPGRRKGEKPLKNVIQRTPRVGVAYAGPVWGSKPYRFTTSC